MSIFLYADDILLLAPTVYGLQLLLNTCERELYNLDMNVNANKSKCIRFGPKFNVHCESIMSLNGGSLEWVTSCRYLGSYFVSGRLFRCCFDDAKKSFFRAFNAIFSKVGRSASEEVVLSLINSKCVPCLLYGVEACPLYSRDKRSFDFTFTRLLMKLFCTGSRDVISQCQLYFNFLPLRYQIDLRTAKFLHSFSTSDNDVCLLFKNCAASQLDNLFANYGNIRTISDLLSAVNKQFIQSVT